MPVNEKQLATWSNAGAAQTAEATYTSIKTALSRAANLKQFSYEVYLQGSYGNATNIYGNSDVDIVVELNSAYYYDISRLTEADRTVFNQNFSGSKYTFSGFRQEVQSALQVYYGSGIIKPKNKCILVEAASGRLDADVIPCLEHRLYKQYSPASQHYDRGIKFFTLKESRAIVNFPRLHRDCGTAKNKRVTDNYKPAIRVFKNWRDRLITEAKLKESVAPSYFIECLLSNIPDVAFIGSTWNAIVFACLKQLEGDISKYMCQNGVVPLFGDTQEQWNVSAARAFTSAVISDWNAGR